MKYLVAVLCLLYTGYAEAESPEVEEAIQCLAENIYFEARGQSIAGQLAVGHVTINRVDSDQFPNTVCEVVYQAKYYTNWKGNYVPKRHQCQFSWYCDGKPEEINDRSSWKRALMIAEFVFYRGDDSDMTGGSLWYHARHVEPYWASSMVQVRTIDDHVFYVASTGN